MGTENNIFRKKALERISSPEQLTDYLRVTNPGVWAVLAAVIILLLGLFVWSCMGSLQTRSEASVIVEDRTAVVVSTEGDELTPGMTLIINSESSELERTETDDYGRSVGFAEVDLPDGRYDAEVVTEEIKPIDFLLRSDAAGM